MYRLLLHVKHTTSVGGHLCCVAVCHLLSSLLDNLGAYQAAALSVRDNMLVNWNETQLTYTRKAPKRAYYLSLEFLMGRTLDNAVCILP